MLSENPAAIELEPWLVVLGEEDDASLALWQLEGIQSGAVIDAERKEHAERPLSVAIFSDQPKAVDYAEKCCRVPARTIQVDQTRFLSLMVDCFRQGIRYATLNPGDQTAHSVFVLRDVLRAAKDQLAKGPT